ncbi:teichoic acid biosynthesis protein C [Streptomyces sp. NPDC058247]|uniref:phage baseplate protein n=1 Tax=Streptomyces sp. NPDC058247 TaxID=3346401 RepID=UPI0036EC54D9
MTASTPGRPGRRAVLMLGSAATLTSVLPIRPAYAAPDGAPPATAGSKSANLTAAGRPWILGGRLHHTTVLQSFAFDERRGHIYALQVMQGGIRLAGEPRSYSHADRAARGDLCLNRLTMAGELTGHMYLKGFGHGGAIGVDDTTGGSAMLWTEWDAGRSGLGRGICRFRFAERRVLDRGSRAVIPYRPVPGSTNNYAAVDPVRRRLLLRYRVAGVPRFALHDLDRFAARDFRPLADFPQPGAHVSLPFQGMALYGDHAYQLLGRGYGQGSPSARSSALLYRIDLATGQVAQRVREVTAPALRPREPEGLAMLRRGGPWLCLGYTQGPPGQRAFSLYYKEID